MPREGAGGAEARNRKESALAREDIWKAKTIQFLIDAMTNGRVPVRDIASRVTGQEEIDANTRIQIAQYLGNKVLPSLKSTDITVDASTTSTMTLVFAEGILAPGSLKTVEDAEVVEPDAIPDMTPVDTLDEPDPAPVRPRRKRRGEA